MSPDKICSNIFFFNLDNLERREKEKKEQKLRVINKFTFRGKKISNILKTRTLTRSEEIVSIYTWCGILWYHIYGSRENLTWRRRGGEESSVRIDTRKNRFRERRVFSPSFSFSFSQVRCNRWKEEER